MMGQRQSVFQDEQIEQYSECTFFTRKDILRLYKRFSHLNPVKINSRIADVWTRLSFEEVQMIPELRVNPFRDRICEVFSTDGYGLNFEDFLDLFSVFSERAPWDLKATYAFRIFDFNRDNAICKNDIEQVLLCLTGITLIILQHTRGSKYFEVFGPGETNKGGPNFCDRPLIITWCSLKTV